MKSKLAFALMSFLVFNSISYAVSPFDVDTISVVKEAAKDTATNISTKAESVKNTAGERVKDVASVLDNVGGAIYNAIAGADKAYDKYYKKVSKYIAKSFKIPGHDDKNFVCQGITYLNDTVTNTTKQKSRSSKYALLSYYPKDTKNNKNSSQLVVVDLNNGKAIRRFDLYSSEGKIYNGHAGGITLAGNYVWVASGHKLYGFKTQEILDFINSSFIAVVQDPKNKPANIPDSLYIHSTKLVADKVVTVDSKASFVSFDGTYLWVGNFVKSSSSNYSPIKHHATNSYGRKTWISGYKTNKKGVPTSKTKYTYNDGDSTVKNALKPDVIICCRESVQGMSVFGKYIALSISYGSTDSKLAIYKSPLSEKADTTKYTVSDKSYSVNSYELADKKNYVKTITLAAGSEDLDYDGKYLYVTFEGGSPNYKSKWQKQGGVIEEKFYMLNCKKLTK